MNTSSYQLLNVASGRGTWSTGEWRRSRAAREDRGPQSHKWADLLLGRRGGPSGKWVSRWPGWGHCHGLQAARSTVHWRVLGSLVTITPKNAVLSPHQTHVWAPGSQCIIHGSVMFMHLVWKRGVTDIDFCVAVRWPSQHMASQQEFSPRSGMCAPVQGWWDQAFLLQGSSAESGRHFLCRGPLSLLPRLETLRPMWQHLWLCWKLFLGVLFIASVWRPSPTQSSSHLGLTNFMQLAALTIWMHSLKDSTAGKQLIMGKYAFWDR